MADVMDVVVVEVGVLLEVVMAVLGLTVRVRRVVIAQDDVKRRKASAVGRVATRNELWAECRRTTIEPAIY